MGKIVGIMQRCGCVCVCVSVIGVGGVWSLLGEAVVW